MGFVSEIYRKLCGELFRHQYSSLQTEWVGIISSPRNLPYPMLPTLVTSTTKTHCPSIPYPMLQHANIALNAFVPIRLVRPSKLNANTNVLPYPMLPPSNIYHKNPSS